MAAAYPLTGATARGYCPGMRLAAIGASDVGRRRSHDEDAFLVMPEAGLVAVADGLGGHASGEVASRTAVDALAGCLAGLRGTPEERVRAAFELANETVNGLAQTDPELSGMGTTLVAALFSEEGPVAVAHVGDSRAYLFRDGKLSRLTEDHSLLQDFIRQSRPTPEEIEAFPHKNVIVRALGMRETVEVDVALVEVREGDLLLLCSDGLFGMVDDVEMAGILRREGTEILRANQQLVDAANEAGGVDNVTSVLVEVVEGA
jgi:serine/threonine protein phosphatase PrpC